MGKNFDARFNMLENVMEEFDQSGNEEKFNFLQEEAFNGNDPYAFYFLGIIYYYGMGGKVKNAGIAGNYLEKAIRLMEETESYIKYEKRTYRVYEMQAWILESGELVEKNYHRAYKYYLRSSQIEESDFTLERLGVLTYWGYGCEQDYLVAYGYFEQAANYKRPLSNYYLATMFRDGVGIEKSVADAVRYFEKAAEYGSKDAMSCLGYIYSSDYTEWETDLEKSSYWNNLKG